MMKFKSGFFLVVGVGLSLGSAAPVQAESVVTNAQLVRDFPGKLEQIRKKQREYREQWRKANKPEARKQVLLRAKQFVVRTIVEDIFPAWMGTPWHMGHDDDACMPHQPGKRVSCSYFVTAVLQNVGLRLDSRSRWANSRALHIQYSLAPGTRNIHRYGSISPKELSTGLVGLKPGLYLIGLNCHIGFILIADGRARFIHSNYVDPEEGVTDETVAESRAIANSQKVGYWVSPLFQDDRLIEYWLTSREVPLQKADASLIRGKKYSMSSRKVNRMLSAARELLGVSYQMGGRLREPGEGIDCQGLIYYAAKPAWPQEGVSLTPPEIRFPKGFGRHRIYLDAGHGSSGNTGTTSAFCESEQDHNIRVANHLAGYLENTGHFQVRVSRKGDQRVSYRRRLKQATRWNAEVFVSLHSDARGSAEWWSPVAGKICLRNFNDPGFSVLWSDEGNSGLISRRHALAGAIAGPGQSRVTS
jgi:N-acetylmuramoyl-L-alanine amidase